MFSSVKEQYILLYMHVSDSLANIDAFRMQNIVKQMCLPFICVIK